MSGKTRRAGFTLVELLVVMAIIATLLSVAAPRYLRSIDDAREATLKAQLSQLREALDRYHADRGVYPGSLTELVEKRYLRSVPTDPITDSAQTWQLLPYPGQDARGDEIYDVRSGAPGTSRHGEPYANW